MHRIPKNSEIPQDSGYYYCLRNPGMEPGQYKFSLNRCDPCVWVATENYYKLNTTERKALFKIWIKVVKIMYKFTTQ